METALQSLRDASHIKNILDDQSLTFAEKAISIKNAETRDKKSKILEQKRLFMQEKSRIHAADIVRRGIG